MDSQNMTHHGSIEALVELVFFSNALSRDKNRSQTLGNPGTQNWACQHALPSTDQKMVVEGVSQSRILGDFTPALANGLPSGQALSEPMTPTD